MKKLGFLLIAFISLTLFANDQRLQMPPNVEILHTADPFDGTFKTRVSLPINMTGMLYFRVLNIDRIANQPIFVHFTFRNDPMRIILPATINTAPGITPDLHVEYLRVELRGQPFLKIKHRPLLCSLFGTCPETTRIDIVTRNPLTGRLTTFAATQNIKFNFHNANNNNVGREILYSEFRSCFSSMDCTAGNCCFNGRCWARTLAGQCLEDTSYYNQPVGYSCSSNYECSSLCCNNASRTCGVLESNDKNHVLCNQLPGSLCIDKTWCQEESVRDCRVIKTGMNPLTGALTCSLFCYERKEHGDCVNHRCQSPRTPPVPYFDPNNPNCSAAIDPISVAQ